MTASNTFSHAVLSPSNMASYADSAASFKRRVKEVRLTDRHLQALERQDIQSFNSIAYATAGSLGQSMTQGSSSLWTQSSGLRRQSGRKAPDASWAMRR